MGERRSDREMKHLPPWTPLRDDEEDGIATQLLLLLRLLLKDFNLKEEEEIWEFSGRRGEGFDKVPPPNNVWPCNPPPPSNSHLPIL